MERLYRALAASIRITERKRRMRRRIRMLKVSFEERVVRVGALETVKDTVVLEGR